MSRRTKHHAKARASQQPRITAAALPAPSPSIQAGGGIRTTPTPLRPSWRPETSAQAHERLIASRFLQECIPFIGYLNTHLPEEALGNGLTPTSESAHPEFKEAAVAYFDAWARTNAIDVRGRFDFYSAQSMLGQTMLGDGEVFALMVADERAAAHEVPLSNTDFRALRLQFLTRDQLGNTGSRLLVSNGSGKEWDGGIQFDEFDQPLKYRILRQRGAFTNPTSYEERDADDVIHIFADRCLNQRHGTPWIFRGENSALDALDLKAVKKYAAKIRAYFLGAITTPTGDAPSGMRAQVTGTKKATPETSSDPERRYLELAGGVALPVLKEGEEIEFFHGQEPLTFAELLKEIWEETVYCYSYPAEYLIQPAGLGSAVVRMVLRKVSKAHERIRRPIREQFCQRVWEFVIGDAIARGKLPASDDWRKVTWKGGVDPSIDAGRDEKAEQDKLRSFTTTVELYCDAQGLDGKTVRHARLDEIADNIRYGASKGLPWFLCIDPLVVQSTTALATSLGVDIKDLVSQIKVSDGA